MDTLIIICIILLPIAYYHGHMTGISNGLKRGAENMYYHIYDSGKRKGDKIIVEMEYEDRSKTVEYQETKNENAQSDRSDQDYAVRSS